MESRDCLYVVFSSTPSKMGKFIRLVTGGVYNHVSISFSDDLHTLYSYARYFKNAPFYGGFVQESALRYASEWRESTIKVAQIPLSAPHKEQLRAHIRSLQADSERHIYNSASAALSVFHKKMPIQNASTCVEFVSGLLEYFDLLEKVEPKAFYSISDLEQLLSPYLIYEGRFFSAAQDWGEDRYDCTVPRLTAGACTARNFGRLAYRALCHAK